MGLYAYGCAPLTFMTRITRKTPFAEGRMSPWEQKGDPTASRDLPLVLFWTNSHVHASHYSGRISARALDHNMTAPDVERISRAYSGILGRCSTHGRATAIR